MWRWESCDGPRMFQLAWALLHGSAAILAALAVVGHLASMAYHMRRA